MQDNTQTTSDEQGGHGAIKFKPLNGMKDFLCWRCNMRSVLRQRDPLLLRLCAKPNVNSAAARTAWEKANFTGKDAITLVLTGPVKVRAMAYTDDDSKSAYELWKFLESTYTSSNEQAIQNHVANSTRSCMPEGLIGMNT